MNGEIGGDIGDVGVGGTDGCGLPSGDTYGVGPLRRGFLCGTRSAILGRARLISPVSVRRGRWAMLAMDARELAELSMVERLWWCDMLTRQA